MFLLAFPLILLAFLGAGAWLLRSLRVETSDVLEETWLAGVLGLLLVGTLATAVGLLGFYTHTGLWLVVAAAILPTFRLWRPLFVGGPWQEQWQELAAAGPLYPALVALLGLFLAFYAFLSLAPNVAWDTMAHHFLVPWMYLREGAIYDLPQVQFSYFPSLLQVTYGLGMGTGGEPAANLLGWWWSAWLLVGILVIGRNLWGWEAGVIGALVMASMEFYGTQLRGGWADAGIALFVLLGGYGPLRWRRTREPGWLYIGALAMGGALAA
ncbi:MAG TPA: hypothetical protein VEI97_13675, partial [bacterium]|nr:hypothetical protein [bacterium]